MAARTGMLHVLLLLLLLAGGCQATQPPTPPAAPKHSCQDDVCCVSLIQDLDAAGTALSTVQFEPRTFDCHESTPSTAPTLLQPNDQFAMCKIEVSLTVDATGAITEIDANTPVQRGAETRQCKDASGKIAFNATDKCTLDVVGKKVTCYCLDSHCNTEDLVLDYLTAHKEIVDGADQLAAFKFKPVSLLGKSRSHPLGACMLLAAGVPVFDQCCRDNFNKHIERLVKHNVGYAWTKNDNLKDVVEMAGTAPDPINLKLKFKCHEKANVDGTGAATTLATARGTPVDKEVVVIDKPAMCVTKVKLEKDGDRFKIKAEYMDYAQDDAECKNGDVNATSKIYPLSYTQEAGCVISTKPSLSLVCYCSAMTDRACNENGHKDIVDFVVDTDDERFSEYKAGTALEIFGYKGTVVSFEEEQKLQTSPTYHRAYLYSNKLDKPSFVTKDPFNSDVAVNKFKHNTYMKLLPGSIIEYSANKKDTPNPAVMTCMVNLKNVDRCNRIYFCKIDSDNEYGNDNAKKMRTLRNFCNGDYMVLKFAVDSTQVDEHKVGPSFTWDASDKKITMKAKHLDRVVIYSPEPECTLSAIMTDGDCYEHSVPNVLRSSMVASGSPPVYPMHMRWVAHPKFEIDRAQDKQQLSKIFPYTRSTDKLPSYKCFASRDEKGKSCRQAKQVVMKLPNHNVPFAATLRVNDKCDWVSMCIYVRKDSKPNSKAEALLEDDPISPANMEHLVSCMIDAVTEVSLANHYVMFPKTNLPVRLPLTKDFYGNHYALTFQRSKSNYISVSSNGVTAKSSLRLKFTNRIMFEFPRDDCLLGMSDETQDGYVLTQGIALHANTQAPDKITGDEVANVDTNVGGAINTDDEVVTVPAQTDPPTAVVAIVSATEKEYQKTKINQVAFSNVRKFAAQDAYLLWSGFIGLTAGMMVGLLIASMFGFICRRSLYKDWYRSMYSRYGSSATTATPTGAGETGMTSAQTGMSMMGGTTTGSTMGGTTAGGTTAGESSTMGGTTVG